MALHAPIVSVLVVSVDITGQYIVLARTDCRPHLHDAHLHVCALQHVYICICVSAWAEVSRSISSAEAHS